MIHKQEKMPRGFGEVDGPTDFQHCQLLNRTSARVVFPGHPELPDPMTVMIYFHFISGFLPFNLSYK